MRMARPYLLALVFVLAVMAGLSLLPDMRKSESGTDVAVFRPSAATRLTNSNLVDMMIGLQLATPILRVEWENSLLTVEFKVKAGKGLPAEWTRDVEQLLRLSFARMENVNRVLIRYAVPADEAALPSNASVARGERTDLADSTTKSRLLLAADIRRTDSWLASLGELGNADPLHDEIWRERLRMSNTSEWTKWYGPVPTYSTRPAAE
ncbi:hypothetical protein SAMN04487969_10967 [Paenibacillus algorifonticola]|uniref:Uncharacterized protein n=1 Tax=Paenibacillus algorifonticola TaxID=684063 RepID=A0A1I2EFC1_9BACL|nr:hypothetical protein [Paenibacillus algorifonticola]SFE91419.1 hypothetical protein SAMN04487969_10967 [Paenibacillus algorifonticola]